MRNFLNICITGAALVAAVSACGGKPEKVIAVVAGKDATPAAVVVKYQKPVSAASIMPETYVVPGKEVAFAFVSDRNPFEKPQQEAQEPKEPKKLAAGPDQNGEYVVVVLKGAMPMRGGQGMHQGPRPGMKPGEGPKPDQPECKAPCDSCGMPLCEECEMFLLEECEECEMAPCDSCQMEKGGPDMKPGEGHGPGVKPGEGPKPDGEPGVKPGEGPEGKAPEVKGIPVPEIAVQQVAPIKTDDGKTVKAWKKAVSATEAVPFMMRRANRHGHQMGRPGEGPGQGMKPGEGPGLGMKPGEGPGQGEGPKPGEKPEGAPRK